MGTGRHHLTTRDAAAKAKHTISILVVCMDGGDVSREDRVRVRVSLAGDSDDWKESERFGGATNSSAVSSVGVVDEEAAVCRWDRPQVRAVLSIPCLQIGMFNMFKTFRYLILKKVHPRLATVVAAKHG